MTTPNIGWLYFKDYFSELPQLAYKDNPDFRFKKKNEYIFKQKLEDHEHRELLKVKMDKIKTFNVRTEYPGLITGTGITHDFSDEDALKLGFSFDHTTGLPYIPASSVKGMLRAYFPQRLLEIAEKKKKQAEKENKPKLLEEAKMFEDKGKAIRDYLIANLANLGVEGVTPDILHRLELNIFEGYDGKPGKEDKHRNSIYQRDIFFDAYPQFSGYEGNGSSKDAGRFLGEGVITPHGTDPLKDPKPIKFLKILPNVAFSFQFRLHDVTIDDITIDTTKKYMLFRELLTQFGIGAKTNVGFGQMV